MTLTYENESSQGKIKREDHRKRNNFFYSTLNNSNVRYESTQRAPSNNNLFITAPIGGKIKQFVHDASHHLYANYKPDFTSQPS